MWERNRDRKRKACVFQHLGQWSVHSQMTGSIPADLWLDSCCQHQYWVGCYKTTTTLSFTLHCSVIVCVHDCVCAGEKMAFSVAAVNSPWSWYYMNRVNQVKDWIVCSSPHGPTGSTEAAIHLFAKLLTYVTMCVSLFLPQFLPYFIQSMLIQILSNSRHKWLSLIFT